MTGSSTQGIKTVLHPCPTWRRPRRCTPPCSASSRRPTRPITSASRPRASTSGWVPGGWTAGMTSPVAYWHVPDIEAKLAEVTAAGATLKEAPRDVGGGRLVATVTDPDGNVLGLLQDR